MNFRTTILLLVVLVAAAAVFFITSGRDSKPDLAGDSTERTGGEPGKQLIDVPTGNVNRVSITPASGDRLVFERVGTSEWRLLEPVKGPADAFKVDELLRQISDLRSRGQVDPKDKGVDKPRYVVELSDKNNKVTKLNVGSRSPVGDTLYVRLEGEGEADVVSSSVVSQLAKGVGDYRKTRVVNVPTDKVTTISIAQPDKTLRLEKNEANDKWQIVEPAKMPADAGLVSSLISSVNSLDAVRFVEETAAGVGLYGLSKPSMTVTLGTAPPETQPTTGPAATTRPAGETTTVKFGRTDVEKTNVYALASEAGPVVTVAATALEAFRKAPLDLRDREVLDVNPDAVSRISITKETAPATQPSTTQPAATQPATAATKTQVVLERRSEVAPVGPPTPAVAPAAAPAPAAPAGPQPQSGVTTPDGEGVVTLAAFQEPAAAPAAQGAQPTPPASTKPASTAPTTQPAATTGPTTAPATAPATVVATQPAAPATKWLLTSDPKGDADDTKVQALLNAFGPLRAEKYLEEFPTTQAVPAAVYVVKISTRSWADEPAREHELRITDPGGTAKLVAQLGDLTFEMDRAIVSNLTEDFTAPKVQPAGPAFPRPPAGLQGLPGLDLPGADEDVNK